CPGVTSGATTAGVPAAVVATGAAVCVATGSRAGNSVFGVSLSGVVSAAGGHSSLRSPPRAKTQRPRPARTIRAMSTTGQLRNNIVPSGTDAAAGAGALVVVPTGAAGVGPSCAICSGVVAGETAGETEGDATAEAGVVCDAGVGATSGAGTRAGGSVLAPCVGFGRGVGRKAGVGAGEPAIGTGVPRSGGGVSVGGR